VLEDGDHDIYNFEMLKKKFGINVANAVLELTKKTNDHDHDEEYFMQIMRSGREEVFIVKAADRLANIRDLAEWTDLAKRKTYIEETKKYVLPIAKKAGSVPYCLLLEELVKYAQ
jgi:(p)ppGpp synthase/HD superfamily hydrolase